MKYSKRLKDVGCHHPHVRSKDQYILQYRHIKHPGRLGIIPLSHLSYGITALISSTLFGGSLTWQNNCYHQTTISVQCILEVQTLSIGWSCARNSVTDASWEALMKRRRQFHYVPLLKILVPRYPSAIPSLGTNILHCSHLAWGLVLLLMITIDSLTCWWMKCIGDWSSW